jgi:hypothetical protein
MIRDWSPEARVVLGIVFAPLVGPFLFSLPFFVAMAGGPAGRDWSVPLVYLIVGAVIAYLNAFVTAAPIWIIAGRNRLVRNHWPLTIGGTLSGIITMICVTRSFPIPLLSFGAVAGFLSALLFWVIALREAPHLRTEKALTGI